MTGRARAGSGACRGRYVLSRRDRSVTGTGACGTQDAGRQTASGPGRWHLRIGPAIAQAGGSGGDGRHGDDRGRHSGHVPEIDRLPLMGRPHGQVFGCGTRTGRGLSRRPRNRSIGQPAASRAGDAACNAVHQYPAAVQRRDPQGSPGRRACVPINGTPCHSPAPGSPYPGHTFPNAGLPARRPPMPGGRGAASSPCTAPISSSMTALLPPA